MKYKLNAFGIWEFGQRKDAQGNPHQEDSMFPPFGQMSDSDRLFILCDGMGGHDAGEVASATVCEAMSSSILHDGHDPEGIFTPEDFTRALDDAFDALDDNDSGAEKKMGTTMTLLKLHSQGATIAHMGDSRVYHIRPGKSGEDTQILFQTRDHSLVNDLIRIGELTPEEARHSKQKNIITRAMQPNMGSRPKADVYNTADIRPGDYFYLCSDGMLEQPEMESGKTLRNIFSAQGGTDEAKVNILKSATAHNRDNHTAIIVHILDVIPDTGSSSPRKSFFRRLWPFSRVSMLTLFAYSAFLCYGQIPITPPVRTNAVTATKPEKPSIRLSLAADFDGKRYFFSTKEWENMPVQERIKYDKIGMVIKSGQEEFLIALNNNMSSAAIDNKRSDINREDAFNKSLGQLPTLNQMILIKNNRSDIDDALYTFGGYNFQSSPYWCKNGAVSTSLGGSNGTNKGVIRLTSNNIYAHFKDTVISLSPNEKPEYIGSAHYNGISVVRHKNKYGFMDKDHNIIVPIQYDQIVCECKFKQDWEKEGPGNENVSLSSDLPLISVSKNGKWGYINSHGNPVVPIIYDRVNGLPLFDEMTWVSKEGLYGCVDTLGNLVIPIIYQSPIYFHSEKLAAVKKDGKWGLIDRKNKSITEFQYDSITNSKGKIILSLFIAFRGNTKIYLDRGGNEYSSEEDLHDNSDYVLADQGYPDAQFLVGGRLFDKQECEKAYPWILKSAEGGYQLGQLFVGHYYYYGLAPISQNFKEAYKWYLKAADQEDVMAYYFLGNMYENGLGVSKDIDKSIQWYKKSKGTLDSEERIAKLQGK